MWPDAPRWWSRAGIQWSQPAAAALPDASRRRCPLVLNSSGACDTQPPIEVLSSAGRASLHTLLSGRSVVLVGDSLTRQHYVELVCEMLESSDRGSAEEAARILDGHVIRPLRPVTHLAEIADCSILRLLRVCYVPSSRKFSESMMKPPHTSALPKLSAAVWQMANAV